LPRLLQHVGADGGRNKKNRNLQCGGARAVSYRLARTHFPSAYILVIFNPLYLAELDRVLSCIVMLSVALGRTYERNASRCHKCTRLCTQSNRAYRRHVDRAGRRPHRAAIVTSIPATECAQIVSAAIVPLSDAMSQLTVARGEEEKSKRVPDIQHILLLLFMNHITHTVYAWSICTSRIRYAIGLYVHGAREHSDCDAYAYGLLPQGHVNIRIDASLLAHYQQLVAWFSAEMANDPVCFFPCPHGRYEHCRH
jgi:hypothetical protein